MQINNHLSDPDVHAQAHAPHRDRLAGRPLPGSHLNLASRSIRLPLNGLLQTNLRVIRLTSEKKSYYIFGLVFRSYTQV